MAATVASMAACDRMRHQTEARVTTFCKLEVPKILAVMQALEPDVGRPFPANGKIAARYGGQSAEALLELPAPSTKGGAAELAAVVWLTVGLLATDGFALQVC